jgi:hypothetical protein
LVARSRSFGLIFSSPSFQEAETYIRNRDKHRASLRAVELMDIERAARAVS